MRGMGWHCGRGAAISMAELICSPEIRLSIEQRMWGLFGSAMRNGKTEG